MSFFIRKQGRGGASFSSRKAKPGNTDMKKRPNRNQKNGSTTGRGSKAGRWDAKRKRGGGHRIESDFGSLKKARYDPDEEIESSTEDELELEDNSHKHQIHDDEELEETPQQKKVRLAKLYIEEIEKEERKRQEDDDVDIDLLITKRLREDFLEAEGRLRREVGSSLTYNLSNMFYLTSAKNLKKSVTCLCISPNNDFIFSGCKDGHLIKWSVKDRCKVLIVKRKEKLNRRKEKKGLVLKEGSNPNPNSCHSSPITSIAISSDAKYLATGDMDKQVVIWDPETLNRIHIFTGHRGPIRCLVFRAKTHTLYSSSDDRSIRIWSLDEMGYVETLFGHQDSVTSVDALSRERAISSGGRDNSIRIWKIVEESQLVYNGHYNGSVDIVKLVNEENFLSGGDDGFLCTWNVNRKKALFTVKNAHGLETTGEIGGEMHNPRWISALASWTNTDVVASGSNEGILRIWTSGEKFKSLKPILEIPCPGWINSIQFSHQRDINGKFLAVGIGKEHKSGRWGQNIVNAKNSILIIPLCPKENV